MSEEKELYVLGVPTSWTTGHKTIKFFYPKNVHTIYMTYEDAIEERNLRRRTGKKQYQLFKLTEIQDEQV
jgi:hypothetical protein